MAGYCGLRILRREYRGKEENVGSEGNGKTRQV
jgi:hypothetical protein